MKGSTGEGQEDIRGIVWNEEFIQSPIVTSGSSHPLPLAGKLFAYLLVLLLATYKADKLINK